MELLLKKIGIDVGDIQVTKTPYMYFIAVIGFIYVLKSDLLMRLGVYQYSRIIIPLILCCIGITIGYKDLDKYLNWKGGMKRNLNITFICWALSGYATMLIYRTQSNTDVQQLDKIVIPLSKLWSRICGLMLTGIGEEFFKLICFVMIFTLVYRIGVSKAYSIIVGVVLSSLLFGGLHSNYNTEMWKVITLGIGLGTGVGFYFLFKYKTIVPLILAHAIQDIMVIVIHTEYIGDTIMIFIKLILMMLWIGYIVLSGSSHKGTVS